MGGELVTPLADLAEQINEEHHKSELAMNAGLQHAIRAGELLVEAKAAMGHGEWIPWLEANFDGTPRNAQHYMKVAREAPQLAANTKRVSHLPIREAVKLLASPTKQRDVVTGNQEWYTPKDIIEAARATMGTIDTDPASCDVAQETVQAKTYYTIEDDGLSKQWNGTVWLNPPYGAKEIKTFVDKLLAELKAGNVTDAVLLTNNATDTEWFHDAAQAASVTCFTRGRIHFESDNGNPGNPVQGQTLFYFGDDSQAFRDAFGDYGLVGNLS